MEEAAVSYCSEVCFFDHIYARSSRRLSDTQSVIVVWLMGILF
jgi:hypothetical protein